MVESKKASRTRPRPPAATPGEEAKDRARTSLYWFAVNLYRLSGGKTMAKVMAQMAKDAEAGGNDVLRAMVSSVMDEVLNAILRGGDFEGELWSVTETKEHPGGPTETGTVAILRVPRADTENTFGANEAKTMLDQAMRLDDPLDVGQAAKYLGVAPRTLLGYVSAQECPAYKVGKELRFFRSDLDRWIRSRPVKKG